MKSFAQNSIAGALGTKRLGGILRHGSKSARHIHAIGDAVHEGVRNIQDRFFRSRAVHGFANIMGISSVVDALSARNARVLRSVCQKQAVRKAIVSALSECAPDRAITDNIELGSDEANTAKRNIKRAYVFMNKKMSFVYKAMRKAAVSVSSAASDKELAHIANSQNLAKFDTLIKKAETRGLKYGLKMLESIAIDFHGVALSEVIRNTQALSPVILTGMTKELRRYAAIFKDRLKFMKKALCESSIALLHKASIDVSAKKAVESCDLGAMRLILVRQERSAVLLSIRDMASAIRDLSEGVMYEAIESIERLILMKISHFVDKQIAIEEMVM